MASGGQAELGDWRFVRLLSAPDPADDGEPQCRLVPPLVSAHAARQPLVVGWLNRVLDADASDDGLVLLAGAPAGARTFPFLSDGPTGQHGCLFPAGGRAAPLEDGRAVTAALASLGHWVLLGSEPALPVEQRRSSGGEAGERRPPVVHGGYEDVALHLADVAFAWLVIAEPVTPDEVKDEFRTTQSAARGLVNAAQLPGEQSLDLAVATARLEHLHRGRSVGLWRVRWLVGSTTADGAREVGELVAAASALEGHPLRLTPIGRIGTFADALGADSGAAEWNEPRTPFVTTSECLAALARTPEREIPGFRLTHPQCFDTNAERLPSALSVPGPAVTVGEMLDGWGRPCGDFDITLEALNRHMFVCGATGSGKSQTVRQVLEALAAHGIPWLVVEPVKAEYRRMADRLAEAGVPVHVIRLGAADQPPCMLNPLEPEAGFNLQTHLDMVTALFLASFEAEEPFPQVLSESLRRCYERLGWDLATGRHRFGIGDGVVAYPTLSELQVEADEVVTGIGYGPEVQANVRGFMKVRLGSLRLGTPGRFFEAGHPLSVARLLERNVVVELEDVGNDADKAFVIGAILLRVVEHLRVNRPPSDVLRHVTVIEEAHRLLRKPDRSGPATHAIETFAGLLAEVRAYGEGLVVAEQIPSKIVPDVVKNTAVQVMHRLPARDDRELVGGAMNMTAEQMGYVVGVGRGQAAVFTEGMDRPVLVAMRLGKHREADGSGALSAASLLAGRRSSSCVASCWDSPCTVTQMSDGAAWASAVPELALYVEAVAVNLLRPDAPPLTPTDTLVRLVRSAPDRERDCGLGQLAQAAVQRRRAVLARYVDPTEVVAHLQQAVRDAVDDAGVARWQDLAAECRLPEGLDEPDRIAAYIGTKSPLTELARICEASAPANPTEELRAHLGRVVAPTRPAEDLANLLAWCFNWRD